MNSKTGLSGMIFDLVNANDLTIDLRVTDKEFLERSKIMLGERVTTVLQHHYGLDGEHPKTLKECGKQIGVGPERVRQIIARALRMIRHPSRHCMLTKEDADFDDIEFIGERLKNVCFGIGIKTKSDAKRAINAGLHWKGKKEVDWWTSSVELEDIMNNPPDGGFTTPNYGRDSHRALLRYAGISEETDYREGLPPPTVGQVDYAKRILRRAGYVVPDLPVSSPEDIPIVRQ